MVPTIEYNQGNDNKYFTEQQLKQLQKNKNKNNILDESITPIDESCENEMQYLTE